MTLSLYRASVPVLIRAFDRLTQILDKGVAFAGERKFDPELLVNARLAADMLPLARQVQLASDTAKGAAARLAGVAVPSFDDTEKTFPELHARIGKTVKFMESENEAQFEGAADRTIAFKAGPYQLRFTGESYLFTFVLPNFFFHITTAYDILRHSGVPLGKTDYLGEIGV
jgi:hypothetical protein